MFYETFIAKIFTKPTISTSDFRMRAASAFRLTRKESNGVAKDLQAIGLVQYNPRKGVVSLLYDSNHFYFPVSTQKILESIPVRKHEKET